jgi:hypothetical protein
VYVLVFVAVSSAVLYGVGRRLGWRSADLGPAFGRMIEYVGLTFLVLVLDVLAAAGTILAMRVLTGHFVSMYLATDSTLIVLAAAQAAVVQWWREAATRPPGPSR